MKESLGFPSFFAVLFGKSHNINVESVRTARAADLVLSRLLRQTDHAFAFFASAVNVSLPVAYAVALKSEKSLEILDKSKKICVFLSSFVEIF